MLAGVALDAGHIYWADYGRGAIGRANIDGTGIDATWIEAPGAPFGVAVNVSHVYWTAQEPQGGVSTIWRARLDDPGDGEPVVVSPAADGAGSLALDAGHIYWTRILDDDAQGAAGAIARASLDGGSIDKQFIPTLAGPDGIAVDAGHIYWSNVLQATIGRADLDGGDVIEDLVTRVGIPRGVAVDPPPPPSAASAAPAPAASAGRCAVAGPPGPARGAVRPRRSSPRPSRCPSAVSTSRATSRWRARFVSPRSGARRPARTS